MDGDTNQRGTNKPRTIRGARLCFARRPRAVIIPETAAVGARRFGSVVCHGADAESASSADRGRHRLRLPALLALTATAWKARGRHPGAHRGARGRAGGRALVPLRRAGRGPAGLGRRHRGAGGGRHGAPGFPASPRASGRAARPGRNGPSPRARRREGAWCWRARRRRSRPCPWSATSRPRGRRRSAGRRPSGQERALSVRTAAPPVGPAPSRVGRSALPSHNGRSDTARGNSIGARRDGPSGPRPACGGGFDGKGATGRRGERHP